MLNLFFGLSLTAGLALAGLSLAGLSLASVSKPSFQFWPPPSQGSWQHKWARGLFRVFVGGLLIVTYLTQQALPISWRAWLGVPLLLTGFGLALRWTNFLGWRSAFGEVGELQTDGAYAWSRNPIYTVSLAGMLGWGLLANSLWVSALLLLWAALYIAAPFVEEPWLEARYGKAYRQYRAQVPRFYGKISWH